MPTDHPPPTDPSDPPDLTQDERLELAHKRYEEDTTISVTKLARKYGIPKSTLQGRIDGAVSTTVRQQNQQRLSPEE